MPMTIAGLKQALKDEISDVKNVEDDGALDEMAEAIATAVVEYIQANALVTGTVTSGVGAGGAVTGTVS
jgi:hypothetical protein